MISTEEARKILQDDKISDEEIDTTVNGLELLAELIFDHWTNQRRDKKHHDKK